MAPAPGRPGYIPVGKLMISRTVGLAHLLVSAVGDSVLRIPRGSIPTNIIEKIVSLSAIVMAGLSAIKRRWPQECLGHETVDVGIASFTVSIENDP